MSIKIFCRESFNNSRIKPMAERHNQRQHGSIECINGQWYVFYHRLTHGSDYSRQACAEHIEIKADGSIEQGEISSCGLNSNPLIAKGKYPSVIACNITNERMPRVNTIKDSEMQQLAEYFGVDYRKDFLNL